MNEIVEDRPLERGEQRDPPGTAKPRPDGAKPAAGDHPLAQALAKRYLVVDGVYHHRDRQQSVAFTDNGRSIAAGLSDTEVARAMVMLAQVKGWQVIRVRGEQPFAREIWLHARAQGLIVRGFRPKAIDNARLAELREVTVGVVTSASARSSTPAASLQSEQTDATLSRRARQTVQAVREVLRQSGAAPRVIEQAGEMAAQTLRTERTYVGQLLDSGTAPYRYDPKNDQSYVVRLATVRGERAVWGKELQAALVKARVKTGDLVAITYQGARPVEVTARTTNADGSITRESKTAHRNAWLVQDMRALSPIEQAAARKRAANTEREPRLHVYDNNAPQQGQERAQARPRTRSAERSRG